MNKTDFFEMCSSRCVIMSQVVNRLNLKESDTHEQVSRFNN